MSRRFRAGSAYLQSATGQARGAVWTAAAWVKIDEAIGKDTSNYNAIIFGVSGTTPFGPSGIRIAKVNGRWGLSAYHDQATDSYLNAAIDHPLDTFRDWVFVAASHVSDGTPPRLYIGSLTHPIVEMSRVSGGYGAGSGASVTATSSYYIAGYGTNNNMAGSVAWAAWWTGAELTPGEIDTYRAETAVGRWPTVRRGSLFGVWPLGEASGTATARDLTAAHNLTATGTATGDIAEGIELPGDLDWWWRDVKIPSSGTDGTIAFSGSGVVAASGTNLTPGTAALNGSGVLAATATIWEAGTVLLGGSGTITATAANTIAFAGSGVVSANGKIITPGTAALNGSGVLAATGKALVAATAAFAGSGVVTITSYTARDLDGLDDQFTTTGVAYTTDWTWFAHVTLDAAGGYLWRAQTVGGSACQTVSVQTIGGRTRLAAFQDRATTDAQCQWELPLPLGVDLSIAVQYEAATGRFRAWAGTPAIPMTELAWRYSQTLGAGATTGGGTQWQVSPSTGRVDGAVGWMVVCPSITTVGPTQFEQMRRYLDPPALGTSGGYWQFLESSGNAADSSGNGRTMTASGSPGTRTFTPPSTFVSDAVITITSIPDCRIFQRNGANQATVTIAGTVDGTPPTVEARFVPFGATPGTWTTIVNAPAGNGAAYSGTFTLPLGQGILEVRANQGPLFGIPGLPDTYSYARRFGVGCGDVYLVVGTSNASGIETGGGYNRVDQWLTDYEFGKPFPVQMSNRKVANDAHEWHEIHDPTDAYSAPSTDLPARTNSIYGPSTNWTQSTFTPTDKTIDNAGSGAGKSVWPAVAAMIVENQHVPVAIVPCPIGGSNLASWHYGVAAGYWLDVRARSEELAGQTALADTTPLDGTQARAVLVVMGENDYNPANGATGIATYEANNTTSGSIRYWTKNLAANLGVPVHLMVVGDWPTTSTWNAANAPLDAVTRVRKANQGAWAETGVKPGPVTYDIDLADGGGSADGFHYRTQAELDAVAKRWYAVLCEAWYGAAAGAGRGPRVVSATRSGTTVTIQFDVAIDAAATLDGIAVYDGVAASPSTRLTPGTGYSAARGADSTTAVVTLAGAPSSTVWVGIGELDLAIGRTVPSVTRNVGGVTVTLPAEIATGITAISVQEGTVAFAGSGVAAVSAKVTNAGVAALAGSGVIAATATLKNAASVALAGSGIMSAVATSSTTGILSAIQGVWVLHEYANTAALTSSTNKTAMRNACDAIGATGKLAGICVRFPWNQVDLVNDPTGAAAYLNAALALRDYVRVNWPGIGLSIRMMAGKYTPASITTAGPYYTYNGSDVPVPWTDGTATFNTAYENAYGAQVSALATWCRANGVKLLHLCWYGRDYSELSRYGQTTGVTFGTPPGLLAYHSPYTSNTNQFIESHRRLIDISWASGGNDIVLEYPLSGMNVDTGASNSIRTGLADKMVALSGGNWSARCAMQANGWGGMGDTASGGAANAGDWGASSATIETQADSVWSREVVRGEQDIAGVTFSSGTWATMFASLTTNEATYCEIYDFTINGNSSGMKAELVAAINAWAPAHVDSGIVDGTVTFVGSGVASADGRRSSPGTAALNGSGVLAATSGSTSPGTVAFAGSGVVAAAATRWTPGTIAVAGSGVVSAAGTLTNAATASFTGSGDMAATSSGAATVTFAGSGVLAATSKITNAATAALTGSGVLAASATATTPGTVALAGSGMVAATSTVTTAGTVGLTGSGVLAASSTFTTPGTTAFAGSGVVVATAFAITPGSTALAGSGMVAATATTTYSVTAGFAASGILTAGADGPVGAASFNGSGILAAAGTATLQATAAFAGSGVVAASSAFGTAANFAGSGVLAATATLGTAANFAGSGALAPIATTITPGTATFSASGVLAADADAVIGTANFAGSGVLAASVSTSTSAAFAATGQLTADGKATMQAAAQLVGAGTLSAQVGTGADVWHAGRLATKWRSGPLAAKWKIGRIQR